MFRATLICLISLVMVLAVHGGHLAFCESFDPATRFAQEKVGPDDLALATKGAVATADSEFAQDAPSAPQIIDGVIATTTDFANRWYASIDTPNPHWIEVKLPKPVEVGCVVIRFADPQFSPVSFQGFVAPKRGKKLTPVFDCTDHKDPRGYCTKIAPVVTDRFRLVIRGSASTDHPNATQISEIELYPPGKSDSDDTKISGAQDGTPKKEPPRDWRNEPWKKMRCCGG